MDIDVAIDRGLGNDRDEVIDDGYAAGGKPQTQECYDRKTSSRLRR